VEIALEEAAFLLVATVVLELVVVESVGAEYAATGIAVVASAAAVHVEIA